MEAWQIIAILLLSIVGAAYVAMMSWLFFDTIRMDSEAFRGLNMYRTNLRYAAECIRQNGMIEEYSALYNEACLDYKKNKDALDVPCPKNPIFLAEVLDTQRAILDFTQAYENAKAKSE